MRSFLAPGRPPKSTWVCEFGACRRDDLTFSPPRAPTNAPMPFWLKILLSLLLVAAVFWFMWRLPRRGESYFGWAPSLALLSPWIGLLALGLSVVLWIAPHPDPLVALSFLALDPAAITSGSLVLWIYRRYETTEKTVREQILQAKVGIALGLLAVASGYLFVFTHKAPGTAVGI